MKKTFEEAIADARKVCDQGVAEAKQFVDELTAALEASLAKVLLSSVKIPWSESGMAIVREAFEEATAGVPVPQITRYSIDDQDPTKILIHWTMAPPLERVQMEVKIESEDPDRFVMAAVGKPTQIIPPEKRGRLKPGGGGSKKTLAERGYRVVSIDEYIAQPLEAKPGQVFSTPDIALSTARRKAKAERISYVIFRDGERYLTVAKDGSTNEP